MSSKIRLTVETEEDATEGGNELVEIQQHKALAKSGAKETRRAN